MKTRFEKISTSVFFKYSFALLVCFAALVTKFELQQYTSSSSAALFYIAVTLSAVVGGFGPGIMASIFCSAAHLYYFIPPVDSFGIPSSDEAFQFFLFLIASILISALTAALHKARRHAVQLTKQKTFFVANVTHELRTPLNAIVGLTNLLLDTKQTEEQKQFVETIQQSAKSLSRLVNEILDFSKLEMHNVSLEIVEFNLQDEVLQCIKIVESEAKTKGIKISLNIAVDVPKIFRGDSAKIGQVLLNLLNNAVKFTDYGLIKIDIQSSVATSGKVKVLFAVTDTGIGIEKEIQEKVFEAFVQGDTAKTKKYSGTGLGLSISRQLVKAMGGEIGLESEKGKGSRFWFCIDLDETKGILLEAKQTHEKRLPLYVQDASHPHVLVADDNIVNQMVIVKTLEKMGCYVDAVSNGKEVLEQIKKIKYDVVFMDCQMPEMDGYEASSEIRKIGGLVKDVPIIALTAYASLENKKKCLSHGMSDYIAKPVQVSELALLLQKWVPHKVAIELKTIDTDFLDTVGAQTVKEVAESFFENTPARLDLLKQAVEKNDFASIEKHAHYLKSSSSVLGAINMAKFCHQLEKLAAQKNENNGMVVMDHLFKEYIRVKGKLQELVKN